jgi:hypothetical protein
MRAGDSKLIFTTLHYFPVQYRTLHYFMRQPQGGDPPEPCPHLMETTAALTTAREGRFVEDARFAPKKTALLAQNLEVY